VVFSTPLANSDYVVSIIQFGTNSTGGSSSGCVWHVDTQGTAGFTYTCRSADTGIPVNFTDGIQIGYIAIANM
jgi:hypothetical protein